MKKWILAAAGMMVAAIVSSAAQAPAPTTSSQPASTASRASAPGSAKFALSSASGAPTGSGLRVLWQPTQYLLTIPWYATADSAAAVGAEALTVDTDAPGACCDARGADEAG